MRTGSSSAGARSARVSRWLGSPTVMSSRDIPAVRARRAVAGDRAAQLHGGPGAHDHRAEDPDVEDGLGLLAAGQEQDERQADERDEAVEDAADEDLVAAAQDRRGLVEDDARASPGRT